MLDINNISFKNDKTWELIQAGHTCGVFQLESDLGRHWAKEIKPTNINELSALTALLRPACLESGQTQTYAKVKNGKQEQPSFNNEIIDRILNPTHGILVYQEQLMKFGSEIAWKDLPELERLVIVDKLRKGIGKKDSKLIQDLKKKFVDGCIKNGITQELADKLFEMIANAGRYAFNDAHAKKYAVWAYRTAYLKANYPYEFYTTYLTYSRLKQKPREEIRRLISEGKMLNVRIFPPSILDQNREFKITEKDGKKGISYGLAHIKQVGTSDLEIICLEKIDTWQKLILAHFDDTRDKKLRAPCVESLIGSGACDSFKVERSLLLEVFKVLKGLTTREMEYIIKRIKSEKMNSLYEDHPINTIDDMRKLLFECAKDVSTKGRKLLVGSEAQVLDVTKKDTFTWRAEQEKELLGLNMTCSAVDDKKAVRQMCCAECYRLADNNRDMEAAIAVVVDEIIKLVTKKGKNPGREMAQFTVSDSTGQVRVVCFPEEYAQFKDILHEHLSYQLEVSGTGKGWCVKKITTL